MRLPLTPRLGTWVTLYWSSALTPLTHFMQQRARTKGKVRLLIQMN